jgi:antirestriction protein ArdC
MQDLYQLVTDRIVAALEAGTPPWVRPWHAATDPVPMNAETRRLYRGVNFLTLAIEAQTRGYPRNCWLTYRQATALGAQVRKGEHGTPVVFWKLRTVNTKAEAEDQRVVPLLRCYTVFNTAQIDGLPRTMAQPLPSVPAWQSDDVAELLIATSGAEIRHGGSKAFYTPDNDYIQLPPQATFAHASGYYATTLHELVHWTGHRSRLDRRLGGRFGDEAYAAEELIAELGSAFLCAHCRVEGQLQHASYVSNWLRVLRSDKRAIFVAGTKAQNAADFLLTRSTETASAEALAA